MRLPIALGLAILGLAAPLASSRPSGKEGVCELLLADRSKATSRACLSCHDGVTFPASHTAPALDAAGSHPFEVDYDDAWMRHPGSLRPRSELPPELQLTLGGKLTCTTCHDGRSRLPHHLAISNDRSALCRACHTY